MLARLSLITSLTVVTFGAASAFAEASLLAESVSLEYQPSEAIANDSEAPEDVAPEISSKRFGEPGTWWWSAGGGLAAAGRDADLYYNAFYSLDSFLAEDFQFSLEFSGWFFDQDDDNALGGAVNMMFRYHFISEEDYTIFASVGIGLMAATESVPDEGSEFNFSPRAGLGFTYEFSDGPQRLVGGVRWQHFSNANQTGSDRNPGTDTVMLYLGVTFPF